MARPLRIQFPDAIYHVMARGNGRQLLFHEPCDYQRMTDGLEKTVDRTDWEVFSYVWMPNHIHLFFRTPKPNLSKGMQYLLSGYANWYGKRHQRIGHLFQGRFKCELIEDDTYFWNVSRYLHLNPVRGKRPLVEHPRDWPWSSYLGYANKKHQTDFVMYGTLLSAWQGEYGGNNPARGYRRFVELGLTEPPASPFHDAIDGWLLGSQEFIDRIKSKFVAPSQPDQVKRARRFTSADPIDVIRIVADYFKVDVAEFAKRRSTARGRDLAAYLAHRHTTATLRELAVPFGLSHPDSVSNLIRRVESSLAKNPQTSNEVKALQVLISKTENRV